MIPRRRAERAGDAAQANLTPMIDVVFLLIIFFLLVAQITRQRTLELDLPRLADPAAEPAPTEGVAIVNVVPRDLAERSGGDYRVGARAFVASPEGLGDLAAELRGLGQREGELTVLVRAARDEDSERVLPALIAVAESGARRVGLVTLEREGAE